MQNKKDFSVALLLRNDSNSEGLLRKKDFWDFHQLLEQYSLENLIDFYIKRNPYGYSKDELINQIINFSVADTDFTPNCFKGKIWELIKLDFEQLIH